MIMIETMTVISNHHGQHHIATCLTTDCYLSEEGALRAAAFTVAVDVNSNETREIFCECYTSGAFWSQFNSQ